MEPHSAPKLKNTHHTITIDCKEDLQLESYPGVFSQIITNLLLNSLMHAYDENKKGRIVIEFMKDDRFILLRFSDDGNGIPEKNLPKIFDPFFTTKRGKGGSGLGLHVVYILVDQRLGGRIHCRSKMGKGTTFLIEIPI